MRKTGFTLIEVILTISIILILGAISAPFYISFYTSSQIDTTTQEVVQSLRRAELKALNNENDDSWSIKLVDDKMILYKGTDYPTRDSNYDEEIQIPKSIQITGTSDITYQKSSGSSSFSGNLTITDQKDTSILTINRKGIVDY